MLECSQLEVGVGDRPLLRDLSLHLGAGDLVCMLGPNGVGKTLTLHTLAGLWQPRGGSLRIDGRNVAGLPRRDIAQRLGLLLQDDEYGFSATVLDAVLLGRHPHLRPWSRETAADFAVARAAMRALDIEDLARRTVDTLSGGERRRVALARLLAQDPAIMLLDEPVNHLDPLHQIRVLSLLRRLSAAGKAILISMHDPALALRFTRSALLLFGDGTWVIGPVDDVITTGNLERLFGTRYEQFSANGRSVLLPLDPYTTRQ